MVSCDLAGDSLQLHAPQQSASLRRQRHAFVSARRIFVRNYQGGNRQSAVSVCVRPPSRRRARRKRLLRARLLSARHPSRRLCPRSAPWTRGADARRGQLPMVAISALMPTWSPMRISPAWGTRRSICTSTATSRTPGTCFTRARHPAETCSSDNLDQTVLRAQLQSHARLLGRGGNARRPPAPW